MFNFWKPFPKYKPKKSGWYQCSIRYGEDPDQAYVMDLYWYRYKEQWRDNRRLTIFEDYDVYTKEGKLLLCNDIISTHTLCVRKDVIAFKKLPKIYR